MSLSDATRPIVFIYFGQDRYTVPRNVTHVIVSDSVTEIPQQAFNNCPFLVAIELPKGLRVIAISAFEGCVSLKRIQFPKTLKEIRDYAFQCTALVSLEFPKGLEKIGNWAFYSCTQLKTLTMASSIVGIGKSAFCACSKLHSVTVPRFAPLPVGIFKDCGSVRSLEIPKSIPKIETTTFKGCKSLRVLAFPASLRKVDQNALTGCDNLKEIFPEDRALIKALKSRFVQLPLHSLCYYHSHYSAAKLMEYLHQAMEHDPKAGERVDAFGMTPFHVLALSAEPSDYLLQELLEAYPMNVLDRRDKWKCSAWDYLLFNKRPDNLSLIKNVIRLTVMRRVKYLGLERWRAVVGQEINAFLSGETSERIRQLGVLKFLLAKYERREALSLLELALWTWKISEIESTDVTSVDRHCCRVNCGTDIVIGNVLRYLGPVKKKDCI